MIAARLESWKTMSNIASASQNVLNCWWQCAGMTLVLGYVTASGDVEKLRVVDAVRYHH